MKPFENLDDLMAFLSMQPSKLGGLMSALCIDREKDIAAHPVLFAISVQHLGISINIIDLDVADYEKNPAGVAYLMEAFQDECPELANPTATEIAELEDLWHR